MSRGMGKLDADMKGKTRPLLCLYTQARGDQNTLQTHHLCSLIMYTHSPSPYMIYKQDKYISDPNKYRLSLSVQKITSCYILFTRLT